MNLVAIIRQRLADKLRVPGMRGLLRRARSLAAMDEYGIATHIPVRNQHMAYTTLAFGPGEL